MAIFHPREVRSQTAGHGKMVAGQAGLTGDSGLPPRRTTRQQDPVALGLGLIDPKPDAPVLRQPVDYDARLRARQELRDGLRRCRGLRRAGRFAQALETLRQLVQAHPDERFPRRLLLRVAGQARSTQGVAEAGDYLITHYVGQGDLNRAAVIYLRCLRACDGYRPADPGVYRPVASTLAYHNRDREALALACGFHKHHPYHPDLGPLYFLGANLLRRNHRRTQALRVVQYLLSRGDLRPTMRERIEALHGDLQAGISGEVPPGRPFRPR